MFRCPRLWFRVSFPSPCRGLGRLSLMFVFPLFFLYLPVVWSAPTQNPDQGAPRHATGGSAFLTEQTQPFSVNGSALPDVDFDIGETYSGLLPVDESGKELFFWFAPSQNPAAGDEITIWLNGGPGCSSLYGFFREQGPVLWPPGSYMPLQNPWTWVNLTNMVWIDQPVGTGFSQGTPNATSSEDAAVQFLSFWKNFVDLFGLHDRKVFITGESFAGQYVPYIAAAMLDQDDKSYFNVSGIMIYDPSFGWPQISKQVPIVAFTDAHQQSFPFNETFKKEIHDRSSSCGYDSFLSEGLSFPPTGPLPPPPGLDSNGTVTQECDLLSTIYTAAVDLNPCFNIYEAGSLCPIAWDVLGNPAYQNTHMPSSFEPYFNRTSVKTAIHAPLDATWHLCTPTPVIANFTDRSPPSGLTGGPLQRVVEATRNVVVAHGARDMILLSDGSLLTLQNLTWNGAQGFGAAPTAPFYVPGAGSAAGRTAGSGVLGRWVSERGMTFCTVELSGHEVPAYQPAAAFRQLEFLLGRIDDLSATTGFTTEMGAEALELVEADCY